MENRRQASVLPMIVTWAALAVVLALSSWAQAAGEGWPRRFEHGKGTVLLYQPQLESFKGDRLTARAAVSVRKKGWKQPVFGVVWLTARALTDRDTRQVTIDEAKVTETRFPNATPEQIAKFQDFLNGEIEDHSHTISLDRLLAMLELVEKEKAADAGLQTKPPKIIFVTNPAALVLLDGDPRLLPLPDSKLMRVANTPFLMVYDPAGKTYFLKAGDTWLKAVEVKGPWQDAKPLPEGLKALEAKLAQGQQPAPQKVEAAGGKLPQIIVSLEPAELIATEGEPQYSPITGTGLLYLSNTESSVFLDTTSQFYYALLSGRWFATKSLQDGPWTYVSPSKLPADFARIPEGSTKGFVLVNVAGTTQARDAVLENSIPQTAAIDREKATTQVSYDGEAKFQKIPTLTWNMPPIPARRFSRKVRNTMPATRGSGTRPTLPTAPGGCRCSPRPRWMPSRPITPTITLSTPRSMRPPTTWPTWATPRATPAPTSRTTRWSTAPATTTRLMPPTRLTSPLRSPTATAPPTTLTAAPGAANRPIITRPPGSSPAWWASPPAWRWAP